MKHTFRRREFLQAMSLTGLGWAMPAGWSGRGARAQPAAVQPYSGPFWLFLHAGGGWDATQLCDPKGDDDGRNPVNHYASADIRSAGALRYAPVASFDGFFAKYAARLLVINGIDTTTNGHDQGVRGTWSGHTGEGYPAFGALVAATYGGSMPMGLINAGGYENTQGVARAVRIGQNGELLYKLACPQCIDPPRSQAKYFDSPEMISLVDAARQARLERQMQTAKLPRLAQARSQLFLARVGERELARVTEYLPSPLDRDPLRSQLQVAFAAYRAGASVAVNLGMGGFDTHSNHDEQHIPNLEKVLALADFAVEEASAQGFGDRLIVVMGSDFGRTPNYNGGRGKDHWPITSMMFMGPGIAGNRVVGATTEKHKAYRLDATTLQPTGEGDKAPGVKLTVAHVHRALRTFGGIPEELQRRFPLGGEALPLLSA